MLDVRSASDAAILIATTTSWVLQNNPSLNYSTSLYLYRFLCFCECSKFDVVERRAMLLLIKKVGSMEYVKWKWMHPKPALHQVPTCKSCRGMCCHSTTRIEVQLAGAQSTSRERPSQIISSGEVSAWVPLWFIEMSVSRGDKNNSTWNTSKSRDHFIDSEEGADCFIGLMKFLACGCFLASNLIYF